VARDEFTPGTKKRLAARVGFVCSNPECRKQTQGPTLASSGSVNLGVAAHVAAASPGGPRFDPSLTNLARRSADNGIWLCQDCAKLVDSDRDRFPAAALRAWREEAEAEAGRRLGVRAPQLVAPAGFEALYGQLERDSNPRFGFSFLHPKLWDRADPDNADGNTYRHPTNPRVEIRAWGGHAVVCTDLSSWVAWTLETSRKKPGFSLLAEARAGGKVVDWDVRRQNTRVQSTQQINGYRIVFQAEEDGARYTYMQTFLQLDDTQVSLLCRTPTESYGTFEELFLVISKEIYILGPSSASYARTGQVAQTAPLWRRVVAWFGSRSR
jgi:hypothetical protein